VFKIYNVEIIFLFLKFSDIEKLDYKFA